MSNKKKLVHFEPSHQSSQNSVKAGHFRPIEINTDELEILIKTAHNRSKINDDTSNKHKDIVKLSKDFLKIVTKSSNSYGKQQYSLDIEVEEKEPRPEEYQKGFWSKIVHFNQPKNIYKVIDATFDPKVFQNQLADQSDHKKKIVNLRVKCLVLITENGSWTKTLSSFISPGGTQSEDTIQVQEVMIEWEEEVGGTRKRYRTRLSTNQDTSLIENYETMCDQNYDIKSRDSFKVELIPTKCPKCGSQQMKPRNIINRTTSNYTNCSNCNINMKTIESEYKCSKRKYLLGHNIKNQHIDKNVPREKDKLNVPREKDSSKRKKDSSNVFREKDIISNISIEKHSSKCKKDSSNVSREKDISKCKKDRSIISREIERFLPMNTKTNGMACPGGTEGGDRINALSADLIEVKQKIVKIIESIADQDHEL